MNPDQLRDILRALAGHLAEIHEDLETDSLHAARQSQTGVRATTTGSRLPCPVVDLDYLITDVSPRIRGWCHNLREDTGITGIPLNEPLNIWCAWLSRHRETLLDMPWADDAAEELGKLEEELRHRLHPTEPEKIEAMKPVGDRDHYAPASKIATMLRAMGHVVDRKQITYWEASGRLDGYIEDGKTVYSVVEAQAVAAEYTDQRSVNG